MAERPSTAPSTTPSSTPPAWVRAADLMCLAIVILASLVAMSGGFRVHIGDMRVAFTDPYRLLLWALAITVVRHLVGPSTPIYRDLPARLAAWWRQPRVHSAFVVSATTRLAVLFIGYLAVVMIGYTGGRPPFRHSQNEIVNLQVRWDAGWYLGIVTDGYSFEPDKTEMQQAIVFFPAYPLLVRGVGRLLGGTLPSDILAGTLVSLGAFFGALVYVYALARDTLDDEQARYAQWLIAAYPFAYFFGAIYTESLFLLAVTGAFYHFTNGQFGRAAVWGLIVGLTRHVGCFLSIPLALLVVGPRLPRGFLWGRRPEIPTPGTTVKALAVAAMPGVGMLIYSAFLWRLSGDPLAWVVGHAAWGRTYTGLAALVTDRYDFIEHAGVLGYVAERPHDLLNALGVIFVLAAVWPVARRVGVAYAVFILINMLPALLSSGVTLTSAGRVSAVLFPAFIWFAGAVPRHQRAGWLVGFATLQAFIAALFYTWRPMY